MNFILKILAIFLITTYSLETKAVLKTKTQIDTGSFVYNHYKPLNNKNVKVRFYNPNNRYAQVLFIMHGNGRNAESYFKSMLKHAKKNNILLIVPEFDTAQFTSAAYHRGNVLDKKNQLISAEKWTFSIIEPLFDFVKERFENNNSSYALYGFSAGSQFVHRFLMFVPKNRVYTAILGSAGTYTLPDYNTDYEFGLKNVKLPQENLNKFYSKKVNIIVGDADTVLSRADLVKTEQANLQGRDRVARGLNFFEKSKEIAKKQNVPFNWSFALVPNAGHSQSQMASTVVKLLYEK